MNERQATDQRRLRAPFVFHRKLAHFLAALAFLAATVVNTWPLARDAATKAPFFEGDTALNAYILAWGRHALLHRPWDAFDAPFFYPMEHSIALSENMLGVAALSLFVAPLSNPVLVYNIMLLLSYLLSALLWYAVLRAWGLGWAAAWAGGLCFGFTPWRNGQLGHVQLLFTWWLPVALYCVERWTRRGGWRAALGAGLAVGATFYCSVYNWYFLMLYLLPFGLVGLAARGRRRPSAREAAQFIAACALCAALLLPSIPAYQDVKALLGDVNPLRQITARGASISDYLRGAGNNLLWSRFAYPPPNPYSDVPWEHSLLPGIGVLALGLLGLPVIAIARRKRGRVCVDRMPDEVAGSGLGATGGRIAMLAAGGAWMFMISLGPRLHWFGKETSIRLPYELFYHLVPGFDAMRVPCRASLFVALSLSGLAAYALDGLFRCSIARKAWIGKAVGIAIVLVLAIEQVNHPFPVKGNDDYARHVTVQRRLTELASGPILVLPLDHALNFVVPLATTPHFMPVVNAVSGHIPPATARSFEILRERTWDESQFALIRWLGIRYLFIDHHHAAEGSGPPQEVLASLEAQLTERGFSPRRTVFEPEGITLLELNNPLTARQRRDEATPALDVFATLNDKRGKAAKAFVWIKNSGEAGWLPREARKLDISARGYDDDGERLWRRAFDVTLAPCWVNGQTRGVAITVPLSMNDRTTRIKFRVRQEMLDVSLKYRADLEKWEMKKD